MYYLQSRYYNPEWGRFINADGIIGLQGELLSHNLFSYCMNNPINNYDPNGNYSTDVFGEQIIIKTIITTIIVGIASTTLLYEHTKSAINYVKDKVKSKSNKKSKEKTDEDKRVINPRKQESKVWKELKNTGIKDRKTTGEGRDKKFYEWDYTHNDIEVYDYRNKHLGSMDPTTGEMYKPPVKAREIKK